MYLRIDITDAMRKRAEAYAKELGTLRGSFMHGARNMVGYLGDEIFQEHYPEAKRNFGFHYNFEFTGKLVDVRARTVGGEPNDSFEMALHLTRKPQSTDVYFFTCIRKDQKCGWLIGWLTVAQFLARAQYLKAGSAMPQGGEYRTDSHIITFNQLNAIKRGTEHGTTSGGGHGTMGHGPSGTNQPTGV